ncbi:MAG TPA: FHA domain-containing protein [Kiritimatiellia bacterium]|jgi:pSer/pThr/pTyr-binding forkhead associated (FHA) protein
MRLRYTSKDGAHKEFELGDKPITIGRSPDADITLLDERVSRVHCGIRLWDGDFYIKDLKSRNGTIVNGRPVDVSKLEAGDAIRVGSTVFIFEQDGGAGTETALRELTDEMELGKGYSTILKEIVEDVPPVVVTLPEEESPTDESKPTAPTTEQKPVRVVVKKRKAYHIVPKKPQA